VYSGSQKWGGARHIVTAPRATAFDLAFIAILQPFKEANYALIAYRFQVHS
jgi:hypothetical protein